MALATRIYFNGSDVDGDGPEQPCVTSTAAPTSEDPPHRGIGCGKIRNARVRITQTPLQGKLFAVARLQGKLVEGVELAVDSVMGEGGWGQLNSNPDNANPSVYYVSDTFPSTGKFTLSRRLRTPPVLPWPPVPLRRPLCEPPTC